jgi:uncharacterized heparinase superfamily protein
LAAQLRVRVLPGWNDPSWVAGKMPPPLPAVRWRPAVAWLGPDPQANTASGLHAGQFTFVADERHLGWPPDWTGGGSPLLWQYNLHYLEWLWALPRDERLAAALDWSRRHPPAPGAVGWAPYPTSLRLATLCIVAGDNTAAAAALWPTIWRQAEYLSRRLEYHLLGNHLLENGIALGLAGACFAGPDADQWLRTGLNLLREQLPEQVMTDGMHFERSPMYQVRLVHALSLLANTGHAEARSVVAEPLARMTAALAAVCHPDGQIALFNDAACGVYPKPATVIAFAAAVLGTPEPAAPSSLPEAGYFMGRGGAGDAVFCDAGPLGPDYLLGHAHGDIFSFELSLGGRRVVVDSGTFDYLPSEMRAYCRSTAAHNTVTVNDADQAEFWGAFRVGRRGSPRDVRHTTTSDGFTLSGWHDGFLHLPGAPIHRRAFRWHDAGVLVVRDEVAAGRPVTVSARLHLHPDCRVIELGDRAVRVACGDVAFSIVVAEGPAPRIAEGWYCPRFGVRERDAVVVLEARAAATYFAYAVTRGHDAAFGPDGQALVVGGRTHAA